MLATSTYGTQRVSGYRLLEDSLNLRRTKIFDVKFVDGKETRELNQKETVLAQQKQDAIQQAFKDWIFRDRERREDLVRTYNDRFNCIRLREYDGRHIRFDGMNPEVTLREHQKNAAARILYGGNTLLAHCMGAGKTFVMVAAAMESKRLGLCRKSLFVVPNHLTEQWGAEFLQLYPGANILVAKKTDFTPANRKRFCSRIATGDYDAIIIGHTQFERIPMSVEHRRNSIESQIDELSEVIEKEKKKKAERWSIKQMEKVKLRLDAKLEKLYDTERKDDVLTFEQLGVDRLFVDEVQAFKNLYFHTKMSNVAGIPQTEAQRSSDLFMKCRYMDSITGGKGVIFATGTPTSNSMSELYTMMRYLQYDKLQDMGLSHFDSWASTFGETVTAIELAPEGTGYRAKTRFARFYNLPELMAHFREVADIRTPDQLALPVPEAEYINVVAKPNEIQREMVRQCGIRAEDVRARTVEPSIDNLLKITSDGRKCALDVRVLDPALPDIPGGKVDRCIENLFSIWKETERDRLTQLVFCDLSTPKGNGIFSVYDDIREKLVRMGVPKEEVAFIHEYQSEVKKTALYKKVRKGEIRILMGSTQKLGAGTNVQDRLIALHHLDVPWRPSDIQQQDGRILRQGNCNQKVKIFHYITENTFDSFSWQVLENKQKFISQIMTSRSPVRSCEDVDDEALSYAQIKSLATGNPKIKQKMDLDIQISKLQMMKAGYQSAKYRMESDIAGRYPEKIAALTQRLKGLKEDAVMASGIADRPFAITIDGKVFTERTKGGEALMRAMTAQEDWRNRREIGNYAGFSLFVKYQFVTHTFTMTMHGKTGHDVEMGRDGVGNLMRMQNALERIDKDVTETAARLEKTMLDLETAKAEVAKPFAQEAELQEKLSLLAKIDAELNLDMREEEQGEGEVLDAETGTTDISEDAEITISAEQNKADTVAVVDVNLASEIDITQTEEPPHTKSRLAALSHRNPTKDIRIASSESKQPIRERLKEKIEITNNHRPVINRQMHQRQQAVI